MWPVRSKSRVFIDIHWSLAITPGRDRHFIHYEVWIIGLFTWCLGTMWYFYEKICRWMIVIAERFAFNIAPIFDIVIMVAYNYCDHYTCIISIVWYTQPVYWIKLSRSGLQNTNTRDFIIKGPKKRPVNWALTSNCLC